MIPNEVAAIAELILPEWYEYGDEAQADVLKTAWRIYNAGYRLTSGGE